MVMMGGKGGEGDKEKKQNKMQGEEGGGEGRRRRKNHMQEDGAGEGRRKKKDRVEEQRMDKPEYEEKEYHWRRQEEETEDPTAKKTTKKTNRTQRSGYKEAAALFLVIYSQYQWLHQFLTKKLKEPTAERETKSGRGAQQQSSR
ncbi:hypothetical protein CBR_g52219 [Chara braunii]|uniref:Uncharacterized protein n=1 Tax=Chara braunii TaxID=69332 RepID=A0A388MA18_CHABU|nr:hypothetical protein CBR_g52219 [Chara braunii]|eukprot:GBG91333.1 hypothetical protein CBR_g52219 [Chara braunii]